MRKKNNIFVIPQSTEAYQPEALDKRFHLLNLLKNLQLIDPIENDSIPIEEGLEGFGTIYCKSGLCTACGKCVNICPTAALQCVKMYDLNSIGILKIPKDQRPTLRVQLAQLIQRLQKEPPKNEIPVPTGLEGYGHMIYHPHRCVACKDCIEACPEKILTFEMEYRIGEVISQFSMER